MAVSYRRRGRYGTFDSGFVGIREKVIIGIEFLPTPPNQHHPNQVQTEADEWADGGKLPHLFDPGHDLGDSNEHAQAGCEEQTAPNELKDDSISRHAVAVRIRAPGRVQGGGLHLETGDGAGSLRRGRA